MTVWEVFENDTQTRFFWYATKKEAQAHVREYNKNKQGGSATIRPVEFEASRKGIVDALNWVITLTCFNEG